ncbi:MAG: NAD-dependent malic enzyme, partial [Candidatus Diapherotrites archaeon]|nr:NAD-dependent malic enzyme [Candidatus Diapherotrites archaeon]
MDYAKESLKMHSQNKGKLEIKSKVALKNKDDLSLAYTPGVAAPCMEIARDKSKVYEYTSKQNSVAVVTDGSAVLGLGNIGPEASLPVMEGKAVLFKEFGGIDAYPICIDSQDTEKIIETVKLIAPGFGGINLEDISAPRCFEIEARLKKELDIPVFHDDQHGTAIVVLAGLINALKVVNKNIEEIKIVISGAGSAGIAITKLLKVCHAENIVLSDRAGLIFEGRQENMNSSKIEISKITNFDKIQGHVSNALVGADVFIGVSAPNIVSKEMIASMASDAIVFSMANPVPEISVEDAKSAGARIIATGRSDFPNQINNVLVFPGVFKGAFDVSAKQINDEMKYRAAHALADLVTEPDEENIIPSPFEKGVVEAVSKAVSDAA